MNIDMYNRDPMLYNTPIGRLRLERHGVGLHARIVVLLCPHGRYDPRAGARVIKRLEPGDQIMDAVIGKQFWESKDVMAAYTLQEDRKQAALEAEDRQYGQDFSSSMSTARRRLGTDGLMQAFAAAFEAPQ